MKSHLTTPTTIDKPKLAIFNEDEMALLLQLEQRLFVWIKTLKGLIDEADGDPDMQAQLEVLMESVAAMDWRIGMMFDELEKRIEKAKEQAAGELRK